MPVDLAALQNAYNAALEAVNMARNVLMDAEGNLRSLQAQLEQAIRSGASKQIIAALTASIAVAANSVTKARVALAAAQASLIAAENALNAAMAAAGATFAEAACVGVLVVEGAALGIECYDIISSGNTYVNTTGDTWSGFAGQVWGNYYYYCWPTNWNWASPR
jgi:hypothetical protein